MSDRFEALAQQLREEGHKLTQQRAAILHALLHTATPLSPAEIQVLGQKYCADLGLVTVYRTLELLEGMQIVRAVHVADNCHGFALSTPGHTHHLVCERCHAVVEIEGCGLGEFLDSLAARTGYQITSHWLEISGLCAECQRSN
ncbi:Fur family transcriptional regulator [Aggregatilinea lenta]|uniref:Fur family transcriptional regulator n=1 Tax=Aggregatilinea lenta TaxID=913108 RepID=UPI000E5BB7AF|nr:transcriptional repressor [Aggregatilinea lenta]